MASRQLPDAIIRPSGVWNTRAPYHNYLVEISGLSRDYSLLTGTIARTRFDAMHDRAEGSTSPSRFMRASEAGPVARKAWNSYRDYWRRRHQQPQGQPSLATIASDLAPALYAVRESTLVRWSSIFETFVQCWALNMLLAVLENGQTMSRHQLRIARWLSPVHTPRTPPPSVPRILDAFPDVAKILDQLPHITTDPSSRALVNVPVHSELTALRVILFWREFRNLLVHRNGRLPAAFCERWRCLFDELRRPYAEFMRPLEPTHRVQLPSMIVPAYATTHNKVAKRMNEILTSSASERRGRVVPAGEEEPVVLDLMLRPPPMLMDGDHPQSLEWERDEALRDRVLAIPEVFEARHRLGNESP